MKTTYLFCFLFANILYSQDVIQGKIVDSETNTSLPYVTIIDNNNKESISNVFGEFTLQRQGVYRFKKEGYKEKTVSILNKSFVIIQLQLEPQELNEVIVNSNHIPKALKKTTSTIEVMSKKDIEIGNNINIAQVLNRTPGIFVQSGALNTNRFTIRGIGSRNRFGTSNIRAYFNDIPLTNGSGETTIEDFELGAISRIELIKGAASSIYGAGLGGTIHLTSQNAYLNQTDINSEFIVGSFGLKKGVLNFNHGNSKNSFRAVYSNTHSDGYRDNNTYNRQTLTLNTNHFINKNNDISILASYVDLKAFIPSSLDEETFNENPTNAAFTWAQAKGFEDSKRGLFGITWNHRYNDNLKQITSLFTSFREAYEPRPFNILSENTNAYGLRSRLLGKTKLVDKTLNYTVGGEYFKDLYKSRTFQNLYRDFPDGTGSVEGDQLSDFRENRTYYNLFFETNYEISPKTTLVLGLNYNQTAYNLKDRFPISDTNPNQSGDFNFDGILSPKFGITYSASKNINLYSSISQGFSPISLAETLLPDGQINQSLKPETGWNYEVGAKGTLLKNTLQFNLAIYRLEVKNLVVSRRIAEDQFIGINAGKTQHDGLECRLDYKLIDNESLKINTSLNYTLNNFKFEEFIDGDNDFSGNDLTGVPSDIFNYILDISTPSGIYGNINFQYVGRQAITDSNSLYSDSYNLTNLKIGYKTTILKRLNLNLFIGVDNIFDTTYASQILINASSFGGNAPRYFYPGNPINYYSGINLNYTL